MEQQPLLDVDPTARHEDDFYRTPAFMTQALLRRVPVLGVSTGFTAMVMEPCVGDGAIVRELPAHLEVMSNDIVPRAPMLPDFLLDARKRASWKAFTTMHPIDFVVSNLPFDVAFDIVPHALEFARLGVILLLRLSWLEPTDDRGPWLVDHPVDRVIVLPRHDWRGDGKTDSVTSAWLIWQKVPFLPAGAATDFVTRVERDELIGLELKREMARRAHREGLA